MVTRSGGCSWFCGCKGRIFGFELVTDSGGCSLFCGCEGRIRGFGLVTDSGGCRRFCGCKGRIRGSWLVTDSGGCGWFCGCKGRKCGFVSRVRYIGFRRLYVWADKQKQDLPEECVLIYGKLLLFFSVWRIAWREVQSRTQMRGKESGYRKDKRASIHDSLPFWSICEQKPQVSVYHYPITLFYFCLFESNIPLLLSFILYYMQICCSLEQIVNQTRSTQ